MAAAIFSEDRMFSDTEAEVERSPLARFRSEALKYQHTISAGQIIY